jgi:pectate lyase
MESSMRTGIHSAYIPAGLLLALVCGVPFLTSASRTEGEPLPAFPGAEGFGAIAKGGRGGRVIKVTSLRPDGPGSLQAACREKGPRVIVFDVSGVIEADVTIEHGEVSILGQTAPGAGITIAGSLKSRYRAGHPIDDLVIRYLRVRPPKAVGASGDAIQLSENKRVILDHVSCAWAADETIDIYGAQDVTVQWCTVEESLITGHPEGRHNYGLISGPNGARVSIHHTLFAHHARRCPAVANGPADVRNNVVYNFRDGFGHENRPNDRGYNLVGNYYKRGPSDAKIFPFCFRGEVSYYLRDNYIHGVGLVQDPWAEADKLEGLWYYAKSGRKAAKEFPVPKVTTHSPAEAYELVLRQAGGLPRDAVTRRIVREVQEGTGSWGRKPQADLLEGLTAGRPAPDADGDGLPDDWEMAHGLDPKDASDHAKAMPSGYTAIEAYGNELAARRVAEAQGPKR